MMEVGPTSIPLTPNRHWTAAFAGLPTQGRYESAMSSGKRYYVKSPLSSTSRPIGAAMNAVRTHLKQCADDICFYRGAQAESVNHPLPLPPQHRQPLWRDPAMGSWVSYGLGSLNETLLCGPAAKQLSQGGANWSNGFLPAIHQDCTARRGRPILDLQLPKPPQHVQKQNLALQRLNQMHVESSPNPEACRPAWRAPDGLPHADRGPRSALT